MSCHDRGMVLYTIYSERAWDQYYGNPSLLSEAEGRYEDVSGFVFGQSFDHVPWISLDFLHEASIAHSFQLFRSSIFCCATALDGELKRALSVNVPAMRGKINRQTFGQTIQLAEHKKAVCAMADWADVLKRINQVRNQVSAHPAQNHHLISAGDDDSDSGNDDNFFRGLFSAEEQVEIQEICAEKRATVNWLEYLSLMAIREAKRFFGEAKLAFKDA